MVALESQNGEAETFFRTAGATRHSEEMGDSLSSQDSVAQPVAEKKKPGMIQRISAWFVGKKESESLPVPQRKSDSEEQGLRRSASYRRAVDSGRFSGVYINGSSTDDEASEDDDLGEFSQEILADSAQDPAEIETEREKVVNRLQGKRALLTECYIWIPLRGVHNCCPFHECTKLLFYSFLASSPPSESILVHGKVHHI